MATVTISHLLERFEHAARGYLDDVAGEPKEKLATKPVRDDVPLSRAIATLEAVAMPSKAATSAKTKNTRIVLELIQSLQHWRDLQLASVRALEKSMDPESSYAGSAKKAKPASDAHSANPLCERLLFAVEEVFLSGTVAVLSGGNESPSAMYEPLLGSSSSVVASKESVKVGFNGSGGEVTGTVVQLLEQAWRFWTDPPRGGLMKLFQQSYGRCNELWSRTVGQLSTCVLGHVTERLLVGLEHAKAAAVIHGLRYANLGIETLERSQATRLFLRELIPFTVKKVTKEVKLRNVALGTLASVLKGLSESSALHEKRNEQKCLLIWTEVLEESCGAGSAVARATGKRKYRGSRPFLWPVLTGALCCAPDQVFRNGVSSHIEHLITTASQEPALTNMALGCIHDTVAMFLRHHATGANDVFEVLQETATKLIFSASPPKLDNQGVSILSDMILEVAKYNFDFAMLNMVVALIESGRSDYDAVASDSGSSKGLPCPNMTWKIEVALRTLQYTFCQTAGLSGDDEPAVGDATAGDDWATRLDLYRETLSDCFSFVLQRCDACVSPSATWPVRDECVFQLVIQLLPLAFPTSIPFCKLAETLVRAEQLHPSRSVRAVARSMLLGMFQPNFRAVGSDDDLPTFSQICEGLETVVSFLQTSEATYAAPKHPSVVLPSARAGAVPLMRELTGVFVGCAPGSSGKHDLNHLRQFNTFCEATVTIEVFALNSLCSPDSRCYPDALSILENARIMRDDEGHTVADSLERTMGKALRRGKGEGGDGRRASLCACYDEVAALNAEGTLCKSSSQPRATGGGDTSQKQSAGSERVLDHVGNWSFQAFWSAMLAEVGRDLSGSKNERTHDVVLAAFKLANAQKNHVEDDAIGLGKAAHLFKHKVPLLELEQNFYKFVWWKNLLTFQCSAIGVLSSDDARTFLSQYVTLLSSMSLHDAQQLMKHHATFRLNVAFLSSHGWSGDTSLVMDSVCSGLGAIPCNSVQTELLLQLLWDHEVDVLPEDGGIGERYDDDPSDPTKAEGSWTSKLLGKVSNIKIQAMRRKLVQFSLTSILSRQAQRANVEVWCSDVVQSRVVSFLQKMRDRLEGCPRRYRDAPAGHHSSGHSSAQIPAILAIRELYCRLAHDFAAVVNASDKALGSENNSVLTPAIRASLFETCLEWCIGKPERLHGADVPLSKQSSLAREVRGQQTTTQRGLLMSTYINSAKISSYAEHKSRLHFATCDTMSVLVQGPPFEATALSPGDDGFVWSWVDAILVSMPKSDSRASDIEVCIPREQIIASGAVESILKSNPATSVIPVLVDRIYTHEHTSDSGTFQIAYGYLNAIVTALQRLRPTELVKSEDNIGIFSSLIFLGILEAGNQNVQMRRSGFALLDVLLEMCGAAETVRNTIRSLCSPSFTPISHINKAQEMVSVKVHKTVGGDGLSCGILEECCHRVRGNGSAVLRRQMLDITSPWTQCVAAFDDLFNLSTVIINLDECRCLNLWDTFAVAAHDRSKLDESVSKLITKASEYLSSSCDDYLQGIILRTCKVAVGAARNADKTIALSTCMGPWDPDFQPRDSQKRDASVLLGSSILPLPSATLRPLLGRVMHAGARGVFSFSPLVRSHARSLLINACRSMGRVDHVEILEDMFRNIQDGDTAHTSKVALDGIVAAVVGSECVDEKEILGTLASELVGAAAAECHALPADGSASLEDMEEIRFSFLFYEVLAPRVEYQTRTLNRLAQSLEHGLSVAASKSLHKQVPEYDGTPHSLLVNSIVNAVSMTIETMPADKMLLFPQIVWAAVSLMRPGTGRLYTTSLRLALKVFEKLNPVENSLMRDVVEACQPKDDGWGGFSGVLPLIVEGVARAESDAASVALVRTVLGASREMDYFVDQRSPEDQLILITTILAPTFHERLAAQRSAGAGGGASGTTDSVESLFQACVSAGDSASQLGAFYQFLLGAGTEEEGAKTMGSDWEASFFDLVTRGLLGLFGGSKDRLAAFLRTQLHLLHGDVEFYLPNCVMLLKSILDSSSPLVSSFLRNPGSKILDDISVALTNKLDGEMWQEILPILHTISSSPDAERIKKLSSQGPPGTSAAAATPSKHSQPSEAAAVMMTPGPSQGTPGGVGATQAPSPDENNNAANTATPLRAQERKVLGVTSPTLGGNPNSPFQSL
jgi:hypothetical protein